MKNTYNLFVCGMNDDLLDIKEYLKEIKSSYQYLGNTLIIKTNISKEDLEKTNKFKNIIMLDKEVFDISFKEDLIKKEKLKNLYNTI